jgi:serine/threonine protein kinase
MYGNELQGYRFDKEIGKGAFSMVYLATKTDTGERYAIKRIDKSFVTDKRYKKYLNNEIFILNNAKHENIIKFFGVKTTMNYLYLIFEYCDGGDLQSCLSKYMDKYNKPFPEEIVQYIMKQIISGFVYLHGRQILHRDIKLENILVKFKSEEDKNNLNMLKTDIKITDFGFSRYLKGDILAKSVLGNPINMDPKILRKMARIENDSDFGYDQKADIWSLGTITYELLIGCPAFDATSYDELIQKIEKGNYRIPHDISLSKEAIAFLNGMMRYDPKTRLSIDELAKQFFLTKDISTFHYIHLRKSKLDLAQSIVINAKEEKNSNINNIWSFYDENSDVSQIDPKDSIGNKSFIPHEYSKTKIKDEPKDVVGMEIEKQKMDDAYKNEGTQEKIDSSMSGYLHKCFDEMNKDCFYIEPLLIPTQPSDSYNSVDPISQFMDTL